MTPVLLTVTGLTAGYKTPVASPVSFEVSEGEIVGLAGPNGAGKSTLLAALAGGIAGARLFSGTVQFRPGLRLALQPQRPVKLIEMPVTGREYLRVMGAHRNTPAEIQPLLDWRLDRLSGGQFQLFAIWACLGSPAGLVLLDEPTNNLDPPTVLQLASWIRSFGGKGRGALLISHDSEFLESVCSKVVEVTPWT